MYYNKEAEKVLEIFGSGMEGLSDEQISEHRKTYGENKLYEKKKKSTLRILMEQFRDLLVVILIIAAAISFFTGNQES